MRANYLPDMKQFQLQLYQLSRLIREQLPELYKWLDANEVSPTLYAAPWILTIFSSQFPLGFVTRVFGMYSNSVSKYLIHIQYVSHVYFLPDLLFFRYAVLGIIRSCVPIRIEIARNSPGRTDETR